MFLTFCDIHPFTNIKGAVSVSNSHVPEGYELFIITTQSRLRT